VGSPSTSNKLLDCLEEKLRGTRLTVEDSEGFAAGGRNSKRSRSLIRRSSKKVKQQMNNVQNPEDCIIS